MQRCSTTRASSSCCAKRGGSQKITVPSGVPIVTFEPGDRSLLSAGTRVFMLVEPAADGSLMALRIAAGKDGINPPM